MKPLDLVKRPARWLVAAAVALTLSHIPVNAAEAVQPAGSAIVQNATSAIADIDALSKALQELNKKPGSGGGVEEKPGAITSIIFEKTGGQIDCDYVVYNIRFGLRSNASTFADPAFANLLKTVRLDLTDQLPSGLSIVDTSIVGDVTDASGLNPASILISTSATTNDTMSMADFRLSAADLDGDDNVDMRYVDIKITAKIDAAAFPAATQVDNQADLDLSLPGAPASSILSHDPALPDDGNPTTGAKTKITIDVTKCTPPGDDGEPDPDDACFKVENGTVECDKDGLGTYTYRMTVGPEMAGRVIELSTSTPGVTVAPAGQIVPAGGGVLEWTISGASPGDIVHLVVVGVETFAGPEEGWGICCTQVIEIIIPEDLDCPDPKIPDIKIEKEADVDYCTKEGGCNFTIRVSNVGTAPYEGPIVLNEVTLPGNATIDSGPNAPWVCAPAASPMTCTHPATVLNPGASIDLNIGFMPGPAWNASFIRNCAEYNYDLSGKLLFGSQANDKACASIPLCRPGDPQCTPPVDKKADLQLEKFAREFCNDDDVCFYAIVIKNVGTTTHNGPLTVVDEFPGGAPVSVNFAPTPPWACVSEAANRFRCDHPGLVLVPGAQTILTVRAVATGFPSPDVENCASVNSIPTETNLVNNKDCAVAKLRRPQGDPGIRITKTCEPGVAGGAISCRITVISVGTTAPIGPVRVNDAATVIGSGAALNIETVTPDGAEWSCSAVPASSLSCQIPGAVMAPGTSRHFDVTLNIGNGQRFENCARGSFGPVPGGDIVYPFGPACAKGGVDISVRKTGDAQCQVGEPCTFNITISNSGESNFSGKVQIGDALELEGVGRIEGVTIQSVEPPFGCAPEPTALPFGCDATVNIPAGGTQTHTVTVVIPESAVPSELSPNGLEGRNCVGVVGTNVELKAAGNGLEPISREDGPYSCHRFRLIKEQAQPQCSPGFVLNANGRCVCPEGTTFNKARNSCTGQQAEPQEPQQPEEPKTPEVVTPKLCKLLPGMIRTKENKCFCPRGTALKNGACVKVPPVVQQCKLLPGQIRTESGKCVCPRGTVLGKKGCIKTEKPDRQCKLLPGQIRTESGKCICPRGTVLGRKGCVKIEQPTTQCRIPGQIKTKAGQCVCPRGTRLIDGECARPIQDETPQLRKCPRGTIGVPPLCVTPNTVRPPKRPVEPSPNDPVLLPGTKLLQ